MPTTTATKVDFTPFGVPLRAMSAGPHHDFNDAMSLVVSCNHPAEIDRYWNALLETGGKAQACGWLIDRFGVRWQIVLAAFEEMMRDRDPTRTKRVTDAMLKMVKLVAARIGRTSERDR
jgi:predicted 3-demethylubiquinone-9 3-methyltransferase (glyoxalase superfamily)